MTDKIKTTATLFNLKNQNIRFIIMYYSGSGDDGSIEEIAGYTSETILKHLKKPSLEEISLEDLIDSNPLWGDTVSEEIDSECDKILGDIAYEHLDTVEDWYNNDGGEGTIIIDLQTNQHHIDNNVRYTTSQKFTHKGSFIE
jgi:hypothetical protein